MVRLRLEIPGYRILKPVGKGRMGTVYKAVQTAMERPVAVKVLSERHARNREFLRRFLLEARTLAKLAHPNLVRALDAGKTTTGRYFVVMEFVEGIPLSVHLNKHGKLPEREALEVGLEIARALEHAHQNGLAHGNLRPESVVLGFDGGIRLWRFGLGGRVSARWGLAGDPLYTAPELARDSVEPDARADLYSLGALLYHMLTGSPPFSGKTPAEVILRHATEPPIPPRKKARGIGGRTNRLVLSLLAKRPQARPNDAGRVRREIEEILQGPASSPEKRPGTRKPAPATAPRRRSLTLLVTGVTAGVVALAAVPALLPGGSSESPPSDPPMTVGPAVEAPEVPPGPAPEPGPVENTSEDREEQFVRLRDGIRKRADWLWDKQSPVRLTEPYERLTARLKGSQGTPLEAMWLKEITDYVRRSNERIEPLWTRIRERAQLYVQTGDLGRALDVLASFPEDLKYFRRRPPVRRTEAGEEHDHMVEEVRASIRKKNASDLAALMRFMNGGDFERAWTLLDQMGRILSPEVERTVAGLPARLVRAEYKALFPDPPTSEGLEKLRARFSGLAGRHPEVAPQIRSFLREAEQVLAKHVETLRKAAASKWAAAIHPTVRKHLRKRDTAAARKVIYGFLFEAPEGRTVRVEGIDLKETKVEKLSGFLGLLAAKNGNGLIRRILAHLRAVSLLERLYRLALAGLKASERDAGLLKSARTPLLNRSRIRVEPQEGPAVAAKIRGKILNIAPVGEITMHPEDVVTFALRALEGDPDRMFHLAAGLHGAFSGAWRLAEAHLSEVRDPDLLAGLDPIRREVADEVAKLPPPGMGTEPAGAPGRRPRKDPGKRRYPFAGTVRVNRRGILEVVYEFRKAAELGDFEWPGRGIGAEYEGRGRVRLRGSGTWYWKGVLKGDVYVEVHFTALDDSVGTVIHGRGTERGYATFVDYGFNPDGGGRGRRRGRARRGIFDDQLVLVKLPFDRGSWRDSLLDLRGGAALERGGRYVIWTRKRGDLIDSAAGTARAQARDGEYNEGKVGLWMSRSEIVLHRVRIVGGLDEVWLRENARENPEAAGD